MIFNIDIKSIKLIEWSNKSSILFEKKTKMIIKKYCYINFTFYNHQVRLYLLSPLLDDDHFFSSAKVTTLQCVIHHTARSQLLSCEDLTV